MKVDDVDVPKFVTFMVISFKVHGQTVGKVFQKVREGREGTTSKSEKGKYKLIISLIVLAFELIKIMF